MNRQKPESLKGFLGSADSAKGLLLFWLGGGGLLVSLVIGAQALAEPGPMGLTKPWLIVPCGSVAMLWLAYLMKKPNPSPFVRRLATAWLVVAIVGFAYIGLQGKAKASPPRQALVGLMRPVRVGLGGPDLDACGSRGRVARLNPRGDNFLAVKAAPILTADRKDKLISGDIVDICESTADNSWYGVIYVHGGKNPDGCGHYGTVPRVRVYAGPCKSGWVLAKYVTVFAG